MTRSHAVNSANQITSITQTGQSSTAILHDRAGNMVFDGSYFYQYDGMNRLLAVCSVGTLTPADFDADGRILESATHTPDSPKVQFVYDGLGRLIRKTATTGTGVRSEDYYYDGVRRIQEVVTNTPSGGSATSWTDKEYVYGPDYVDEFVAQVDYQSDPGAAAQVYYTLQDANYNVVALADSTGAIKQQYTFDPYGTLAATEYFDQQPIENNIGHQGLFQIRMDGQTGLSTNTPAIYYNRNRYYSPILGRFIQRDPNETAMPIDRNPAYAGSEFCISVKLVSQEGIELSDSNVYQYLHSNPLDSTDPTGLYDDDNYLSMVVGEIHYLSPFFEAFEDRSMAIEEFADKAAEGEIDLAISDYDEFQKEFTERLDHLWTDVLYVIEGDIRDSIDETLAKLLPFDFYHGPHIHTVYLGYNKNDQPVYVGKTQQRLKKREYQHGGKYELKPFQSGLTDKQARAIETHMINANPQFENKRRSISPERKWYKPAMRWADKATSGRRTHFGKVRR